MSDVWLLILLLGTGVVTQGLKHATLPLCCIHSPWGSKTCRLCSHEARWKQPKDKTSRWGQLGYSLGRIGLIHHTWPPSEALTHCKCHVIQAHILTGENSETHNISPFLELLDISNIRILSVSNLVSPCQNSSPVRHKRTHFWARFDIHLKPRKCSMNCSFPNLSEQGVWICNNDEVIALLPELIQSIGVVTFGLTPAFLDDLKSQSMNSQSSAKPLLLPLSVNADWKKKKPLQWICTEFYHFFIQSNNYNCIILGVTHN